MESLFNKIAGPKASNFIKKRLKQSCFPLKFAKFLRTLFLKNTSGCCFCIISVRFEIVLKFATFHHFFDLNFRLFLFAVSVSREASARRCSVKNVFLKISQNSQDKTCARASFLIKLLRPGSSSKKRLWHRCFPVNFTKFLRPPFLKSTSWRLLLLVEKSSSICEEQNCKQILRKTLPYYCKLGCGACRVTKLHKINKECSQRTTS